MVEVPIKMNRGNTNRGTGRRIDIHATRRGSDRSGTSQNIPQGRRGSDLSTQAAKGSVLKKVHGRLRRGSDLSAGGGVSRICGVTNTRCDRVVGTVERVRRSSLYGPNYKEKLQIGGEKRMLSGQYFIAFIIV